MRWADCEVDEGGKADATADEGANAARAPPLCPWDSRRWPVGGPMSLAGRMYAQGGGEIGPFRVTGGVGKSEWILKNIASYEYPQHMCFALMCKPEDRTTCMDCGSHRHLNKACDPRRKMKQCDYPLCDYIESHPKTHCPTLNNRCVGCGMRGHSIHSDRCLRVFENFEIFEAEAR